MGKLTTSDDDMTPLHVDCCDVWFAVTWNRHPFVSSVSFCPFCGEEITTHDASKGDAT